MEFKDWKSVLEDLKKHGITSDFYMIRTGEGKEEKRTRFMTQRECIAFVEAQIK